MNPVSVFAISLRQLLTALVLLSTTATVAAEPVAETVAELALSSNYLWRGVTQTGDDAAISALLEYHAEQGSYLGAWSSNTEYGERSSYELDIYLGHQLELGITRVELEARWYYFADGSKYVYDFQPEQWDSRTSSTFTELLFGIGYQQWQLGYALSNNFLDSGKPSYYFEINYAQALSNELTLKIHLGSQHSKAIDDEPEDRVGDRSLALDWRGFSVTASYMTDNVDARQSDKIRYVFAWRKRFAL